MVVFPGQEATIDALLAAADDLPPELVLPYPGPEPVQRVRDKGSLAELAREHGLATPATMAQGPPRDLVTHDRFPCVIKPLRAQGSQTAWVARSHQELVAGLAELSPDEPLLIQALASGPLIALGLVVGRDGRLLARFQQKALKIWPPKAGTSSLAVSVAPDEELAGRTATMLADCGFWGMAQAQLIDAREAPVVIDVNPRFYGSLPLALACGVNLPAAWFAAATDRPPLQPTDYRTGVSYRWLEADLSAAVSGAPDRLLAGRAPAPRTGAMWSADDGIASALLAETAVRSRVARRLTSRRNAAG